MSKLGKAILELAKKSDDWTHDGDDKARNWQTSLNFYNCYLSIPSFFVLFLSRLVVMNENGDKLRLGRIESLRIRLNIRSKCIKRYREEENKKMDAIYTDIYKRILGVAKNETKR